MLGLGCAHSQKNRFCQGKKTFLIVFSSSKFWALNISLFVGKWTKNENKVFQEMFLKFAMLTVKKTDVKKSRKA